MRAWVFLICGCAVAVASAEDPVVSGQGRWRYQFIPNLLNLPASEANNDQNGHGLCKDTDGNIYFTFVPKKVTETTQVLVRFAPDGTRGTLLGKPGPSGLSAGIPHGLRFEYDAELKQSFLYHANNDATVIKTTLDGEVIWTANFSHWKTEKPHFWPYKPTDAVVVPGNKSVLLVADGYGSSFIHQLDKHTGTYLGEDKTFGGLGKTTEPLRFDTPHGINLDARIPGTFVIADRSNGRLVWIEAFGKFVSTSPTTQPLGMSLPCNVDVHMDPREGLVGTVPSLGESYKSLVNGSVAIYNGSQALLSVIEVAKTIGHLGHQNPHDSMFLPNGDMVVCCWAGPGNPGQGPAKGTISYWKRLPTEDIHETTLLQI